MHPVLALGERIKGHSAKVSRSVIKAPIRDLSILGLDLALILAKVVVLARSDRYTADVEVTVHHLCLAK